jgi:hypothetical protein
MSVPSEATRKEIAQWMLDVKNYKRINAIVLDGTGFWASSIRAVLTSLFATAGKEGYEVFDDLTEAASFLQPYFAAGAGTAQDLKVSVYQLQNEMLELRDRPPYSLSEQ